MIYANLHVNLALYTLRDSLVPESMAVAIKEEV